MTRSTYRRSALSLLTAALLLACVDSPLSPKTKVVPGPAGLANVGSPSLVISQVYGGGGNGSTFYKNDFIELFNRGTAPVSVDGWSVQYGSAANNFSLKTALSGTIPAGGYFLIQEAAGTTSGGGTTPLPSPDIITGTGLPAGLPIAMSSTDAKVALVNNNTLLACGAAASPCTAFASVIVDVVGYGSSSYFEGSGAAQVLTNPTSDARNDQGCTDTDNNAADFTRVTAAPRSGASPTHTCGVVQVFTSITVAAQSVQLDKTVQLTATARDQNGDPMVTQPTFAWSAPDATIADVSSSGTAKGIAVGTVTVTASAGGKTGSGPLTVSAPVASVAHINEIHYDNAGTDEGEAVEIIAAANSDLTGWKLLHYNGSNGTVAITKILTGIVPSQCSGNGTISFDMPGLQNDNEGLALVNPSGTVVEFLSYEGTVTATAGAANGTTSTDIGVSESSPPPTGFSLQRAPDDTWYGPAPASFGACNVKPVLTRVTVTPTSVSVNGTKQLTATALDQGDHAMFPQPPFTWTSANDAIATVTAAGLATGKAEGTVDVTATTSGVSGTAVLTVTPIQLGSISYHTNSPFQLPVGFTKPAFLDFVRDVNGNDVSVPVTWSADANCVVDQRGYISGTSVGLCNVKVSATLNGNTVSQSHSTTILPTTVPTSAIYRNHLEFGEPHDANRNDDIIITKPQYVLSYNTTRGGPNWVAWELNATQFGPVPRCDCFSQDPALLDPGLPSGIYRVEDNDYRGSGFSRGHMTMSEERTTTFQENATTFYLTNVLPQAQDNNAGPWLDLEEELNAIAQAGKDIYIFAGGIFDPDPPTLKGEHKVAIPRYTWKIALILNAGTSLSSVHSLSDVQAIAIRTPNTFADGVTPITKKTDLNPNGVTTHWRDYETTVDAIEAATGYDFLALLDDEIEIPLEAKDAPPVAAMSGPANSNEGASVQFDASASADPNAGDVLHFEWNFGDGTSGTGAQPTHTFADNGNYTVTVTVYDQIGAFSKASTTITVANVAPSASFAAPGPTTEGSSFTLSLTGATDPSSVDAAALKYAFDCGNGYAAQSSSPSASCATTDNGDRVVHAKVIDKDGAFNEYGGTVQVANVAPTGVFSAPATVNEGDAIELSVSALSDASSADLAAGFGIAFDCGSGFVAAASLTSATCSTDNNGVRTVRVRISDKDGGATEYSHDVTILNVAPTIAALAGATLLPGETYSAASSFTDPGADVWSATVNYGDGSSTNALTLAGKTFSLSHTYQSAGSFAVSVDVSDGSATSTQSAAVVVLTPLSVVQSVMQQVDALTNAPGNSLHAKLDAAAKQIQAGKNTPAANQLNAFLNELDALVRSGRLSEAQAAPLRDAVNRVIASVTR